MTSKPTTTTRLAGRAAGRTEECPRTLAEFRNYHAGATIVVCGCGTSLNEFEISSPVITIGVNDVGRRFQPDYLVVLNPRSQFRRDRFQYVESSRARAVFTQLDLGIGHPRIIRIRLGVRGGTELSDPETLPFTQNSPYVALCLAARMGATRIGVIGVDFTDHHFFAQTGRHVLDGSFQCIDAEYRRLGEALQRKGIEVINLSRISRLTAFRKGTLDDLIIDSAADSGIQAVSGVSNTVALTNVVESVDCGERESAASAVCGTTGDDRAGACARPAAEDGKGEDGSRKVPRVFFVHYRFLSCGDVFTDGLRHAAEELSIAHAHAYWDDPRLVAKVCEFSPDLLFVVHGRRFAHKYGEHKYGERMRALPSAVWLVDEPYEVDDTATWSRCFDTVFVNDPVTLDRHRNAYCLPAAFDPHVHRPIQCPKSYEVGFVGGANPTREGYLMAAHAAGLLSYVVGGPWTGKPLERLCLARNIPAVETARLYQQTRIVINVFRDRHHFNRRRVAASALNPRVYEALACGALVVSENRSEVHVQFPLLPTFAKQGELLGLLRELRSDPREIERLRAACVQELPRHTYARRLQTVLDVTGVHGGDARMSCDRSAGVSRKRSAAAPPAIQLGPGPLPQREDSAESTHDYTVIVVVHNCLRIVQLATLRLLRHSRGARLIVVDNASDDGSGEWLRILERRGDIELIRCEDNIGHGLALERARQLVTSPYLVTLDSDAFPLCDDWLLRLRSLLSGEVQIAGIRHHRDYIHPSCLMISTVVLDDLHVTFLNEKDQSSRFDVAERISYEIKRRGGRLFGLPCDAIRCPGSRSEPVPLGATYGGLVYHQWYTTRFEKAASGVVDDVPPAALQSALQELYDDEDRAPRDVTIVMGVRAGQHDMARRRNVRVALERLNRQSLARWRFRIVVIEQDSQPRLKRELSPLCDRYIFAFNPGPYNRGWAFNVGAMLEGSRTGVLCLIDADLLVPDGFLQQAVETITSECRAALPYSRVVYLSEEMTREAVANADATSAALLERVSGDATGRVFTNSQGGCLWIDARLYREIGGHDEQFQGWGGEDREFYERLARATDIRHMPGTLLHLAHPPVATDDEYARANRERLRQLRQSPLSVKAAPIGDISRYQRDAVTQPVAAVRTSSTDRTWQRWDCWSEQRIRRILEREQELPRWRSARGRLAELACSLGQSILDVGCGPGAIWSGFDPHRCDRQVVGVDVTHQMLAVARRMLPTIGLLQADACALPFADSSFDVVVLRHLLEHLPEWLMRAALAESMRVARSAVLLAFYVPPSATSPSRTRIVGEGFLESCWSEGELLAQVDSAGYWRHQRLPLAHPGDVDDDLWILRPRASRLSPISVLPRPRFSIILPTYRRGHTLRRTIESIEAQEYPHWELIVVDNFGDVDATGFSDERICVYRHTERPSASYARNQGLQHAGGDLTCFFDDDDDMWPNYLSRFAETFVANPAAKMVRCGMVVSEDRTNYSYATPECCLLRRYATPTWTQHGPGQDQKYFRAIIRRHGWTEQRGDIVTIREPLCRANTDPVGGLRAGHF